MTNRIVLVVPCGADEDTQEYGERIQIIEQARNLTRKLGKGFEAKFRAGIGKSYPLEELKLSYGEAYRALSQSTSSVAHVDDLPVRGQYEGNYPDETERRLFALIAKGDWPGARQKANEFFDWMVRNYYEDKSDIQLKVLEFVIWAEREAFMNGGIGTYGFHSRKDYMADVLACPDTQRFASGFSESWRRHAGKWRRGGKSSPRASFPKQRRTSAKILQMNFPSMRCHAM